MNAGNDNVHIQAKNVFFLAHEEYRIAGTSLFLRQFQDLLEPDYHIVLTIHKTLQL